MVESFVCGVCVMCVFHVSNLLRAKIRLLDLLQPVEGILFLQQAERIFMRCDLHSLLCRQLLIFLSSDQLYESYWVNDKCPRNSAVLG